MFRIPVCKGRDFFYEITLLDDHFSHKGHKDHKDFSCRGSCLTSHFDFLGLSKAWRGGS
jgi:hypothetical protein